eukprot:1161282-Pelagomonas_calceolata.AAC.7
MERGTVGQKGPAWHRCPFPNRAAHASTHSALAASEAASKLPGNESIPPGLYLAQAVSCEEPRTNFEHLVFPRPNVLRNAADAA